MRNEHALVAMLAQKSQGFIGDDAAVLPQISVPDAHYVVSQDCLVEDQHFRTRYTSPEQLAHKALHVNLSDLAAMGAYPKYVLCSIAIPKKHACYAQNVLSGLLFACQKASVVLIGGDTTGASDALCMNITAIGICQRHQIKYRTQAKVTDKLCIAGNLGYAHLGWLACEQSKPVAQRHKDAFLRPQAKIQAGIFLGQCEVVTSMIDLSDGLYVDLKRLCHTSGLGGVIEVERLTYDLQFHQDCVAYDIDPITTMLSGGEDYGLLCTVGAQDLQATCAHFVKQFGYPLQCIGSMTQGAGVCVTQKGHPMDLPLQPFSHFGENDSFKTFAKSD